MPKEEALDHVCIVQNRFVHIARKVQHISVGFVSTFAVPDVMLWLFENRDYDQSVNELGSLLVACSFQLLPIYTVHTDASPPLLSCLTCQWCHPIVLPVPLATVYACLSPVHYLAGNMPLILLQ